jgi:hypothetical protein
MTSRFAGSYRETRLLVAAGAAGPVTFWLLGLLAAVTWPGYDPVRQSISLLANAPFGWLQTAAFVSGAILGLGWAIGAPRVIGTTPSERRLIRAFLLLQVAISVGFALFPTDPDGVPLTTVGAIHLGVFYTYAVATPLLLVVFGLLFRRDRTWQRAAAPTLAAAAVMIGSGFLVPVALYGPLLPWLGLLERLYVAIPMGWQVVVAIRAYRLSGMAKGG